MGITVTVPDISKHVATKPGVTYPTVYLFMATTKSTNVAVGTNHRPNGVMKFSTVKLTFHGNGVSIYSGRRRIFYCHLDSTICANPHPRPSKETVYPGEIQRTTTSAKEPMG